MYKKALTFAFLIALTLAGCGGGGNKADSVQATPAAAKAAITQFSGDEIKIGRDFVDCGNSNNDSCPAGIKYCRTLSDPNLVEGWKASFANAPSEVKVDANSIFDAFSQSLRDCVKGDLPKLDSDEHDLYAKIQRLTGSQQYKRYVGG